MIMPRSILALRLLAAAAATLSLAGAALAEPKGEGRPQIVQELVDCRKLTDDSARLACYDKAAASLDQAEQKGDIVVVDREQARKVRRQTFGFSIPSLSLLGNGDGEKESDTLTGVVASVHRDATGRWMVRLAEGGTWTQVTPEEIFPSPRAGMPVRIRRASLGSFMMSIDNRAGFRARRVE
jgi:hypothetical protein